MIMADFEVLPDEIQERIFEFFTIMDKFVAQRVSRKWHRFLRHSLSKESVICTRDKFFDDRQLAIRGHGQVAETSDCDNQLHHRQQFNTIYGQLSLVLLSKLISIYKFKLTAFYLEGITFNQSHEFTDLMTQLSNMGSIEHLELSFLSFTGRVNFVTIKGELYPNLVHFASNHNLELPYAMLPMVQNMFSKNQNVHSINLDKFILNFLELDQLYFPSLKKVEITGSTKSRDALKQFNHLLNNYELDEVVLRLNYLDCDPKNRLDSVFELITHPNNSLRTLKTSSFVNISQLHGLSEIVLFPQNCSKSTIDESSLIDMLESAISINIKVLKFGYGFKLLPEILNLVLDCFVNLEELSVNSQDGNYDLPVSERQSAKCWNTDQELLDLVSLTRLSKLEFNYIAISDLTVKGLINDLKSLKSIVLCHCPAISNQTLVNLNEWSTNFYPRQLGVDFEIGKFTTQQLANSCPKNNVRVRQIRTKISNVVL